MSTTGDPMTDAFVVVGYMVGFGGLLALSYGLLWVAERVGPFAGWLRNEQCCVGRSCPRCRP